MPNIAAIFFFIFITPFLKFLIENLGLRISLFEIIGKRTVVFLILSSFLMLGGCTLEYLTKVGTGEAKILLKRRPVSEMLHKKDLSAEQREKLLLILEVKKFSEEKIGLHKTEAYLTYSDFDGDIYNLTGCQKDRFEAYVWSFPIVGKVPYVGFFNKEDAVKEKEHLENLGYDTYLRGVRAFSTLGWFDDPILPQMLKYDEGSLANLIIHELTHSTIFIKDDIRFNEGLATFVGNAGSLEFLKIKYGEGSPLYIRAKDEISDSIMFSQFIEELYQKLNQLYTSNTSKDEKLRRREEIFIEFKERFYDFKKGLKTDNYAHFEERPWNNALLLSKRHYEGDLLLYQKIYAKFNYDLKTTFEFLKKVGEEQKDPLDYLRKMIK